MIDVKTTFDKFIGIEIDVVRNENTHTHTILYKHHFWGSLIDCVRLVPISYKSVYSHNKLL